MTSEMEKLNMLKSEYQQIMEKTTELEMERDEFQLNIMGQLLFFNEHALVWSWMPC